ncbi:MAG: diguanylate cyclase [Rhodocyclaceae bacterium]|nr:diguanylate cyclase [Rhodocyclaceae bacterium]
MSPIDISKFEQLKATGELPSPKGVALSIIRLTQRDDISTGELARVIKSDPAFVARLVRAANGLVQHSRRPVASVQDALIVLGVPAVRNLALGFSLLSHYGQGKCAEFDYEAHWSGSIVCAIAMQALAVRVRAAGVEETFCVGLLARIGELALATLYPDEYSRALRDYRADHGADRASIEQRRFGVTGPELSAAMLGDWGIPRVFTDSVLHHELPERAGFPEGTRQFQLTLSLALARQLAAICMGSEPQRDALMQRALELGTRLGVEHEALVTIADKVVADWNEWSKMLALRTQSMPAFDSLVQRAQLAAEQIALPADVAVGRNDRNPLRIVVVDDDPTLRATLKAVLEKAGHEVQLAPDGRAGLEIALEIQPQLMIIDWLMPAMDGIELTRALRETRVGRSIYIIILTSLEDDDRLVEAFEAGVDDFIAKPFKPRVLAARIRAGQRVIRMQQEIERDREEIRHFAAELAVTNRRLQEVALTDALTGFPNRRYAMDRISQEWAATTRSQRPLCCMMIDLDGFKQINDTYGHDVGDAVLRQAAQALKRGLRAQDVVCRTGGDEFLVICPDTGLEQALACGERVRRAVETMPIMAGMLQLKGSISVGVAVREADMPDYDALIKRADQAVYVAKQRGRNRVECVQKKPN